MDNRNLSFLNSYLASTVDNEISEESLNYSTENLGQEILIMTIEIGDGITDELIVRENDRPSVLADQFCRKHGMGPDVKQALLQQIEQNLDIIYKEEAQGNTSLLNESYEKRPVSNNSFLKNSTQNSKSTTPTPGPNSRSRPNTSFEKQKFENVTGKTYAKPNPQDKRSASAPREQRKYGFNSDHSNNGEKLYYKGLLLKDRTEKRIQYLKHVQTEAAMKDITFHPRINSRSSYRSQNPEVYLLEKGKERNEFLERKRGEKLAEEMSMCTFRPNIDKKSTILAQLKRRPKSPDRCVALYENAKIIAKKHSDYIQNRLKEECPFIPDTSKTQKVNKSFTTRVRDKISNSRKSIEDYINRSKILENIDPETGQQLFHPRIGRPPSKRSSSAKNIGERLYSAGKRSSSQEFKQESPKKLANAASEKILAKVKSQRYRELFDLLSPNDGYINKETIERSHLPVILRRILTPLLDELAKLDERLNYEEFYDSMEMLMKVLNPTEKSLLLMTRKPQQEKTEYSFKPSLNVSYSSDSSREPIYQRQLRKLQETEERIKRERVEKAAAEMSECTFKPKIKKYSARELTEDSFMDSSSYFVYKPIVDDSSMWLV
ncbi:unnamed protein product [Blepharisma stoltei]|uniref:Uncharacterized protein n=1 Tax=Blepharisma stoltei TaxID=1481888 RepID=A0AAU9I8I0_9CILI|nr:unnamed protein product [Blepharisma stoltei]